METTINVKVAGRRYADADHLRSRLGMAFSESVLDVLAAVDSVYKCSHNAIRGMILALVLTTVAFAMFQSTLSASSRRSRKSRPH
jgi:hypothetical protein